MREVLRALVPCHVEDIGGSFDVVVGNGYIVKYHCTWFGQNRSRCIPRLEGELESEVQKMRERVQKVQHVLKVDIFLMQQSQKQF